MIQTYPPGNLERDKPKAKRMNISGRSKMSKAQLQRAVDRRK